MKAFSSDRKLYLHMNGLTAKGILGVNSSADFPVGQWFKGADTTFVLKFLIFKRRLIKVVRLGMAMLTLYTRIAAMAHSRSLPRFKLTPKYHMLMHVVYQLMLDRDANRSPINPLAYSCQMPEDFINRVATLARAVNPRFVPERTLYLYKVALAKVWE
ncbi:unnamed protein product [Symbiodinium necroappetens]|uniref:Uncharacterized protein n=1 Tax=Symbiodinium necroappetens TaxID=1628268 RepID=A0A812ZML1_9DINO|nr:unnamed protein product [Symbiodinium necroappetens]